MESIEALFGNGGWVVVLVLAVCGIVAMVIIAMPFLVWGTHSRVRDLETALRSIASDTSRMVTLMPDNTEHADTTPSAPLELLAALSTLHRLENLLIELTADSGRLELISTQLETIYLQLNVIINRE